MIVVPTWLPASSESEMFFTWLEMVGSHALTSKGELEANVFNLDRFTASVDVKFRQGNSRLPTAMLPVGVPESCETVIVPCAMLTCVPVIPGSALYADRDVVLRVYRKHVVAVQDLETGN